MNGPDSPIPLPVVLVRCRPDGRDAARVRNRIAAPAAEPSWVFFQGDGVEWAGGTVNPGAEHDWLGSVAAGSELLVCTGSWARRSDSPVPLPFRAGSLGMLFSRLVPVSGPRPQLICFGRGDD